MVNNFVNQEEVLKTANGPSIIKATLRNVANQFFFQMLLKYE
jgi:hypothetical protein